MKLSSITMYLPAVTVVAILVAVVPVSADDTQTECADGWMEKLSRCYYFSNDTVDWYTAWQTCSALRAHLYSVDSRAERDSINGYITRYVVGPVSNWWTSGSNLHLSGDWAWYGTMRKVVYQDFCSEADPNPAGPNNIGNCLSLSSACSYEWVPVDCLQNSLRYICEKDANLAPKI